MLYKIPGYQFVGVLLLLDFCTICVLLYSKSKNQLKIGIDMSNLICWNACLGCIASNGNVLDKFGMQKVSFVWDWPSCDQCN